MRELAGYAVHPGASKGRAIREPAPSGRTEFQRDRDRIVHSSAFRRLEYKTQVFVNHEGDHFRTRLTHSIEVAQIARSIARSLKLNEDLVEAIALAHDLGHTPFGHAGQDALNECMRNSGGFEHNLQSLRVVDLLEQRYAAFDGLNLCYETREGILKHCSLPHARELGELGQRFLKKTQPSLEAQIANIADEIAYNNHDVDDGLRSGLISIEQLESVSIFKRHVAMVKGMYPGLEPRRLIHETVRRMISTLIGDLVNTTQRAIDTAGVARVEDVRAGPSLVTLSSSMQEEQQELKRFLHGNLYRHAHVNRMSAEAKRVVAQLFQAFSSSPALLPAEHRARHERDGPRAIADYVAGMTDRYAMSEHRRLSGANVDKVPD